MGVGTSVVVGFGIGVRVGFGVGVDSGVCVGAAVGNSGWSVGANVGAGVLGGEQLAMHNPMATVKRNLVFIFYLSSLNW